MTVVLHPARAMMRTLGEETIADEKRLHDWLYDPVRPMPVPRTPWKPGTRVRGDCSKGCQYMAFWSDAPDPMLNGFGSAGNSSTMTVALHDHLDSALHLAVGDYVTFGYDGRDHATFVLEAASPENHWDPLLWSFGHQGAPNAYRLSYDRRPRYFLRNPIPVTVDAPPPVPPVIEELRVKTGWFAWTAWRLGEGSWRPYGKSNRKVRPDVSLLIPRSWWVREVQYLAARNKPNGKVA